MWAGIAARPCSFIDIDGSPAPSLESYGSRLVVEGRPGGRLASVRRSCRGCPFSVLPHFRRLLLHLLAPLGKIGQTNAFVVLAPGNDAVIEGHARSSAPEFAYFERGRRLLAHIQSLAIAGRREENVILEIGVYGLREHGVEDDAGGAVGELT